MTIRAINPGAQLPLRRQAEARLQGGTAPKARTWATGAEALSLLHKLASNPASASDALALLHELQVHQVELDLQHEQLEQGRDELDQALDRYVERFDCAPAGFFAVGRDGRIAEANPAAAELSGIERAALGGRQIDSLVTPQSRPALLALLQRLRDGGCRETCEAQIDGAVPRAFQVLASVLPRERSFLIMFVEAGGGKKPDPGA